MVPRAFGVERWLLWLVDSAKLSRPCLGLPVCIAVSLLLCYASNPCLQQKAQKLFGGDPPRLFILTYVQKPPTCLPSRALQRVQSLPAIKSTKTLFWRGSPALVHFDLLPRTTHLLAQRSLQRVKSLPATKSTEIALAGIPRASSFRVTSRKHPPACLVLLATQAQQPSTLLQVDGFVADALYLSCSETNQN